MLGVSVDGHLMEFYRAWLDEHGVLSTAAVRQHPNGDIVKCAGLVVVHQAPPTAKGVHFITLEDEHGLLDLIIRPDVYERYHRVLHGASLLVAAGTVQRRDGTTNVITERVAALQMG
jgi:error-prone DNA polymerase